MKTDLFLINSKGNLYSAEGTWEYRWSFMEYPSNLIVDWRQGVNYALKYAFEATELDKEYF